MKTFNVVLRPAVLILVSLTLMLSITAQEPSKPKLPVKNACVVPGVQGAMGCVTTNGKPGIQKEECTNARVWMPVGGCAPLVLESKPGLTPCAPGSKQKVACLNEHGEAGIGWDVCSPKGYWVFEGCIAPTEPKPPVK